MYVIFALHASRSNASGSVPPRLLEGLAMAQVAPAQSRAHEKVYVPTAKPSTATTRGRTTRQAGRIVHPLR
jgi:hypothetical protein